MCPSNQDSRQNKRAGLSVSNQDPRVLVLREPVTRRWRRGELVQPATSGTRDIVDFFFDLAMELGKERRMPLLKGGCWNNSVLSLSIVAEH